LHAANYRATENGKSMIKLSGERRDHKTKNKNDYQRKRADPGRWLYQSLCVQMSKTMYREARDSKTLLQHTDFKNNDDMRNHFESQFIEGMNHENYGKGVDRWNIGHRIARAMYDKSNPEDTKRCWRKSNLFPQWEAENKRDQAKLPLDEVLLQIRDCWPSHWNDKLPSKEERVRYNEIARIGKTGQG